MTLATSQSESMTLGSSTTAPSLETTARWKRAEARQSRRKQTRRQRSTTSRASASVSLREKGKSVDN